MEEVIQILKKHPQEAFPGQYHSEFKKYLRIKAMLDECLEYLDRSDRFIARDLGNIGILAALDDEEFRKIKKNIN